ncbi:hypothetical protein [Spiroplasma floricola]|uniref:Uncharacterized protein n=1 Tax=Spiroplasma floricola 23-6 TaxID=1336749 RepID=A0A2K8SDJ0_9MOLU|nr:hypothetical protein [Spiroplasma floricola]AUB31415.1 hypothetical protein SFLOR_v1c03580 [Spiroplasma floricola 23-6]
MTEVQANKISEFIDNLPEEIADKMFEEFVANISLYFAIVLFGEEIDKNYEALKLDGKSLEEIAKVVKESEIGEEEIYSALMASLQEESDAELFAEDCVQSIAFSPELPEELLAKLKELDIDINDFAMNLIITLKDEFIDFFVNDLDVEEWKNDIIEALVASWD